MSKENINLPKTSFSMKANLPNKEPEILKIWEQLNLYERLREAGKGKEKFVLHDGPPYANGNIHLGHLLNKVIKDIVVRSRIMEGYDLHFVPGWDCHGLPIEHQVMKELGAKARELDTNKIRQKCEKYAQKWVKTQAGQMKRLGTVGHISQLRRTGVGPFCENAAISLDILETLVHSAGLTAHVLPIDTALADIPALELTEYDALRLRSGQTIAVNGTDCETIRVTTGKRLVALAKIRTGHLRPLRVFNL